MPKEAFVLLQHFECSCLSPDSLPSFGGKLVAQLQIGVLCLFSSVPQTFGSSRDLM